MPHKKPISRKKRHRLSIERAKTKITQASVSNFVFLSEDAIFEIISYCDVECIFRMKRVCQVWHRIIAERWKKMVRMHSGMRMTVAWPEEIIDALREEFRGPLDGTGTTTPERSVNFKWISVRDIVQQSQWLIIFEFMQKLEWIQVFQAIPPMLPKVPGPVQNQTHNYPLDIRHCKYLQVRNLGSILNSCSLPSAHDSLEEDVQLEELDISDISHAFSMPVVTFFHRLQAPHLKKLTLKRYEFVPAYFIDHSRNLEYVNLSGSSLQRIIRMPSTLQHLDISSPRGYKSCPFDKITHIDGLTHLNMEGNTSLKQMGDLLKKLASCKRLSYLNFRGCFGMEQVFQLRELFFLLRKLDRCICDTGHLQRVVRPAGYRSRILEEWCEMEGGEPTKVRFVISHIDNNVTTFKFKECK